jgi:hypothetical protein
MELKVIKSKITKLLKSNGFIKSEVKKEWNHPKYKHAGFDYNDITIYESYLSYYIPDFVYHDEEVQMSNVKEKVELIYNLLKDTELSRYLEKFDYAIKIYCKD